MYFCKCFDEAIRVTGATKHELEEGCSPLNKKCPERGGFSASVIMCPLFTVFREDESGEYKYKPDDLPYHHC